MWMTLLAFPFCFVRYNATHLKEVLGDSQTIYLPSVGKMGLKGGIPSSGRVSNHHLGAIETHDPVEPTFVESALIMVRLQAHLLVARHSP